MQIKKAAETRIFSKSTNLSLVADNIGKTENPVLSAVKKADINISKKDLELLSIESSFSPSELRKWQRMSPSRRERLLRKATNHPAFARLETEIKKEKEKQKYQEEVDSASSENNFENNKSKTFSESKNSQTKVAKKSAEQSAQKSAETGAKVGAEAGARAGADAASAGSYEIVRAAEKAAKKISEQVKSSLDKNAEGKNEALQDDQNKSSNQSSTPPASAAPMRLIRAAAAAIVAFVSTIPMVIVGFLLLPLIIVVSVITIFTSIFQTSTQPVSASLSQSTIAYADTVHDISQSMGLTLDDEQYILAIIEVESHGTGNNPMQWSNDVTGDGKFDEKDKALITPEMSIRLGIGLYKQLRDRQASTGCDLETMIQSYNYGPGFINFVMANGGKYSEDLAQQFSDNMKSKHHLKIYGDPSYVTKWKKYVASESGTAMDSNVYQTIHDEAYKYIGKAYAFGGSSPSTGFDCSGFTQWCFAKAGISLPRTAQEQYNATTHISIDQAQPGDLVFFTGTYQTSNYITHVEIYVGNHTSIGAGSPIKEHNLDGTYYKNHYVCFGRVTK
ncbi:MAG: C40 family peptidase [Lachnospiraceae bacterium]|nr:C40 family peptidase [Lachnospiraceae bacterium]